MIGGFLWLTCIQKGFPRSDVRLDVALLVFPPTPALHCPPQRGAPQPPVARRRRGGPGGVVGGPRPVRGGARRRSAGGRGQGVAECADTPPLRGWKGSRLKLGASQLATQPASHGLLASSEPLYL